MNIYNSWRKVPTKTNSHNCQYSNKVKAKCKRCNHMTHHLFSLHCFSNKRILYAFSLLIMFSLSIIKFFVRFYNELLFVLSIIFSYFVIIILFISKMFNIFKIETIYALFKYNFFWAYHFLKDSFGAFFLKE